MSMVTSMAGAFINVILNFMLIPEHGAMGAAVATMISYMAVYVIRAYDTRFYLRFNMHTVRVIVNTLVLCAQAFVMIESVRYWKYIQIAIVLFMLIFNGREILATVGRMSKKIFKKSQKNEKKTEEI